MNWRVIRYLIGHELRMLLRDRRTVVLSLALPLVLMPMLFYFTKAVGTSQKNKTAKIVFKYAVTGTESVAVRAFIAQAQKVTQKAKGDAGTEAVVSSITEVTVDDPATSLARGEIHFYLKALDGAQADALAAEGEAEGKKEEKPGTGTQGKEGKQSAIPFPSRRAGVPLIQVYFHGDRNLSQLGTANIIDLLGRGNGIAKNELLREHGFPYAASAVVSVEKRNLASAAQTSGSLIGRGLTVLLVMLILTGGSVAAIDIVAGEKERGSLETLLTTAVKRTEVAAAKQLAILSVALAIAFIQLAEIILCVTFKLIPLSNGMAVIDISPLAALALLMLFIPLAAFLSAALLAVSAYSKSYKEAQLYFAPLMLACLAPALVALLPGLGLRSIIAVVPLANVSVAVREIMVGRFDWPMLGVVFLAMTAAAAWTVRASSRMLRQERLIMAGDLDAADLSGGAALFSKRVLRWYLLLWIVFFVAALNVPQLSTFRAQVFFNLLGVFLGGSLLMIRWYRLDIREAWALRCPKALVWPAIVLMIPAANILASGVFQLASLVVPVPTQLIERFSESILTQGIPVWQMVVFIAILPDICEELAFRGTLLYGLHSRFHPVVLAVVSGVIFGLFHVDYFRIAQTGFLGIVLTAIALITGSIFPGMLLHFGNNAFSYLMSESGWSYDQNDWRIYVCATAIFALCLYVIWHNRTPYPGLRKRTNYRKVN
ncbi:MAG: ABC transporter permease subunit [Acidobacteriota bacterium]|jgi:sodium transport system permease protein|nr:ABC transporter permease subunit [Acidobacteriota bacterium]